MLLYYIILYYVYRCNKLELAMLRGPQRRRKLEWTELPEKSHMPSGRTISGHEQ